MGGPLPGTFSCAGVWRGERKEGIDPTFLLGWSNVRLGGPMVLLWSCYVGVIT